MLIIIMFIIKYAVLAYKRTRILGRTLRINLGVLDLLLFRV